MWQHWINFILGILLLVFAYTGINTGMLATIAILIVIFALWGGLAGSGNSNRRTAQM